MMKITKIGHCCLLIEVNGQRIVTDPGRWSNPMHAIHHEAKDIDIVLITHEHGDHLHMDSLKEIIAVNPNVKVITNTGVSKLLDKEELTYELLEGESEKTFLDTKIAAIDGTHGFIHSEIDLPQNTGFFINNQLFYPGDAYIIPGQKVEILALPVAGPWVQIGEAIDYAREIGAEVSFPVHDGMLKHFGPYHFLPKKLLGDKGLLFKPLLSGETLE